MKSKQIEKLLKGVYDNFLKSIDDNDIKEIIKNNTFVTGGCIPSMLMDEFVNDFDIYFYNSYDADKVKYYYKNKKFNKNDKFKLGLITENSINLSDKIQLIIKWSGTPWEITKNFDWQHIKSYYKYPDELNLTDDVYKLIVEKELVYTGSKYPLSSLLRLKKYIKKGWFISNITMVHIVLDIIQAFYNPKKEYNQNELLDDSDIITQDDTYEHKFSVEELI